MNRVNELFRLQGGVRRDPAVDIWLDERQPDLGAIARQWFEQMRACGDDVLELVHDGCPVACVEDAPFAYVNVFKAHVNVGFFVGADLPDPAGLLEGSGRRMRHVKVRVGAAPDADALSALIEAAYGHVKLRLELEDQIARNA
jgi:hypothetical protein